MNPLHVIAAGASKELVTAIGARLSAETGVSMESAFGAVGAMQERFLQGEPCDVLVLTQAQIAALAKDGHVVAASAAPLGRARTGIAVRAGAVPPAIGTAASLAAAFTASRGIHVPDTEQSTAGRHVIKVLRELGIAAEVAPYLKSFPNGATAMRALAAAPEENAIGCTQITEINYTPGLLLVGPLPEALGLATIYVAAISARAAQPELARKLVELLAGPEAASLRTQGGFEPVPASS
jgi:molybdate transport system substrate-binding protein